MSSKDAILNRLRAARTPFTDVPPVAERNRMTPLPSTAPDALQARFIAEAEKVSAKVYACADAKAAINRILDLVGADKNVMAWDFRYLPDGLQAALAERGISPVTNLRDTDVRVGITGADYALAATGSLVLSTGEGKSRAASLLVPLHIAVVRHEQIIADLEAFFEIQRAAGLENFRASANTVIITGGSRTADIAQELIQGAHGPVEVHIVLVS